MRRVCIYKRLEFTIPGQAYRTRPAHDATDQMSPSTRTSAMLLTFTAPIPARHEPLSISAHRAVLKSRHFV